MPLVNSTDRIVVQLQIMYRKIVDVVRTVFIVSVFMAEQT